MRMTGSGLLRLMLALTVLVSIFIRPPGTMLAFDGDTITYALCTSGETEAVTVALGGENTPDIDLGCDFFAAQIADLPILAPDAAFSQIDPAQLPPVPVLRIAGPLAAWPPYTSRAPPVVS